MSDDFQRDLQERNAAIQAQGLWRRLRRLDSAQGTRVMVGGRSLRNFSSNDYLGLAAHPALRAAVCRAVGDFGAGAGASRLICGALGIHHELEEALAAFKGTEAALVFSSGYAAAAGTVGALLESGDVLVVDKLVHACIVDAARVGGARLRVFAHNDLNELEDILRWTRTRREAAPEKPARVLIVTESVFSMDGDLAPLRAMVELKHRYGAWLMVDEAHATGLFGERRSGLVEHLGLGGAVEIQMGTLGKALGAAGGCICGSRALVDFLINRARSFIFSPAPAPAVVAAARAAVGLVQSGEGAQRCERLWAHARRLREGISVGALGGSIKPGPIVPIVLGDEASTMRAAADLFERGFLVPGIRFPTVARGAARLRVTLSADHGDDDLDAFSVAIGDALGQSRILPHA